MSSVKLKKNGKIINMRYLPYTSDQPRYPDIITVKFEDGEEIVYVTPTFPVGAAV